MQYVTHSKSEEGFWNNDLGWVFDINDADRYTLEEKEQCRLPISSNNDAEWIVVKYS